MSLPRVFSRKKDTNEKESVYQTEEQTEKNSENFSATHYSCGTGRRHIDHSCVEPISHESKQVTRLPDIASCVVSKCISKKETGSLKLPRVGKTSNFLVTSSPNNADGILF